ncbi:hypothetical protein N7931_14395 [Catenovulum sp. 2E275]|uniref:hypothetical protein n=1 Tax=Catenovulum sp. 2E275 TaxID=2980497 RepID=UPI0021D1E74A|nr:hypothetical protein [Catenovulum sp. 2E275]MCU4676820.1 hypothetical protein [Catenovulum sp. 2E275]
MVKLLISGVTILVISGCATSTSSNYRSNIYTGPTTITVKQPRGDINSIKYKDYTCDEMNQEFVKVHSASLRNLIATINNTTLDHRQSPQKKYEEHLEDSEYKKKGQEYNKQLYAMAKAANEVNCVMTMNNKTIVLAE